MKRLLLPLMLVFMGTLQVGCSKDDDVLAFVKENEEFSKEIKEKGEKEGPEAARKVFDEKKGKLKEKFDAIKDARGFQVKEENMKKLTDGVTASTIAVCGLGDKALCDDYTGLLKM